MDEECLMDRCMMHVSYRDVLYKSNTVVKGGSNMSELDLDKKLEVGDLLVGECRCDPSKKGVIEVVVGDSRGRVLLKFPSKCELGLFEADRRWDETVGGAIGFIREATFFNTTEACKNYHNWKHIPKRDFTFEVGDILYGECACAPSKFVVFEVESIVGREKNIRVVSCWDKEVLRVRQSFSFCREHLVEAEYPYNTLNSYLKRVLSPDSPYNFNQYNYTKYTKAEWEAKKIEEQKRSASKFILPEEPGWTHTFPKSDYKVTETDKEIRVAPRVEAKVDTQVADTHHPYFVWARKGNYVVVKFVIESEKNVNMLRVSVVDRSVCERKNTNRRGSSYQGYSDGDLLYLHFNLIEGAPKTHKETDPLLLPRTFYEENIEDIKYTLREYLEQ